MTSIGIALAEHAVATPAPGSSRRRAASRAPQEDGGEASSEPSSTEDKVLLAKRFDTTNTFQELSARHPGKLYKRGLKNMSRFLAPRDGGQGGGSALQGQAVEYLTTVSAVSCGLAGIRNERELRTLAESIDLLAGGNLAAFGDVLMQRFRAVETAVQENGSWELARHLEVIPPPLPSTLSEAERAQALAMKQRERKAAAASGTRARSPS